MKRVLFLTAVAVAMTACSNDVDLGSKDANKQNADNAIGFQVLNKNMSRATSLEDAKHYNFGVWAYKNTDQTNNIMANYLVGYFGTNKGYLYDSTKQTTHGGTTGDYTDALSHWSYEGLGTSQYVNTSNNNYYLSSDNFYMSNLSEQFLRYWDLTSANTEFCAYAPYINSATPVTFAKTAGNGGTMTFPNGSIVAGYNDESKFEYLCAYANVIKDDYGKDVQLKFEHMNSKIRILFYEDVAGYDVRMLNLKESAGVGVLAVPTEKTTTGSVDTYTYSETLAKTANATVQFKSADPFITFNLPTSTDTYNLGGSNAIDGLTIDNKALVFKAPTATALKNSKAAAQLDAQSWSKTIYYGIPHNTSCGLTFRVSFELKSTSGEIINVYDAGVHVDAANCVWEAGKSYTYIFKITKNTNGTTDSGENDPKVDPNPGDKALFPIVFDGITINDWTAGGEYEYNIN